MLTDICAQIHTHTVCIISIEKVAIECDALEHGRNWLLYYTRTTTNIIQCIFVYIHRKDRGQEYVDILQEIKKKLLTRSKT